MKLVVTLVLFFFALSASAQSKAETIDPNFKTAETSNKIIKVTSTKNAKAVVICVKGIKKIEDIDIENFNRNSFYNLIASKKRKNNIC